MFPLCYQNFSLARNWKKLFPKVWHITSQKTFMFELVGGTEMELSWLSIQFVYSLLYKKNPQKMYYFQLLVLSIFFVYHYLIYFVNNFVFKHFILKTQNLLIMALIIYLLPVPLTNTYLDLNLNFLMKKKHS